MVVLDAIGGLVVIALVATGLWAVLNNVSFKKGRRK